MVFEFDPAKSAANKLKHGIDFEEAQAIWADGQAVAAPARSRNEARFMVIGMTGARVWTAICTLRGDRVRLISVRRARPQEVRRYEST